MNGGMRFISNLAIAAACVLSTPAASSASASDTLDVQATINKWIGSINKGDFKSVVSACAPSASIVDGFPPYAWQSCADWMRDYDANNKAIHGTRGTLSIGKPAYTELMGDHAYFIYPSTFTDTQKGKQVVYKGTMTMVLHKTPHGWVFTGAASAWGVNTL